MLIVLSARMEVLYRPEGELWNVAMSTMLVCGLFVADERTAIAIGSAVGMVAFTASIRMSVRPALALMGLAVVEAVVIVHGTGLSGLQLHTTEGITVAMCVVLTSTLLAYRRQLETALARVGELATTDQLTGLANRRGLLEHIPDAVRRGHPIGPGDRRPAGRRRPLQAVQRPARAPDLLWAMIDRADQLLVAQSVVIGGFCSAALLALLGTGFALLGVSAVGLLPAGQGAPWAELAVTSLAAGVLAGVPAGSTRPQPAPLPLLRRRSPPMT